MCYNIFPTSYPSIPILWLRNSCSWPRPPQPAAPSAASDNDDWEKAFCNFVMDLTLTRWVLLVSNTDQQKIQFLGASSFKALGACICMMWVVSPNVNMEAAVWLVGWCLASWGLYHLPYPRVAQRPRHRDGDYAAESSQSAGIHPIFDSASMNMPKDIKAPQDI